MDYRGTLIAVKDMAKSKRFYRDVLGLEVICDFGVNVALTGGLFLQTADSWASFIQKPEAAIVYANNAGELYFETDDVAGFVAKLEAFPNVTLVHALFEHRWGQRVIRFYDPDGHIIEVGEKVSMVVKRFVENGLSIEECATRIGVEENFIKSCLA